VSVFPPEIQRDEHKITLDDFSKRGWTHGRARRFRRSPGLSLALRRRFWFAGVFVVGKICRGKLRRPNFPEVLVGRDHQLWQGLRFRLGLASATAATA
jgi:hypothetical protein